MISTFEKEERVMERVQEADGRLLEAERQMEEAKETKAIVCDFDAREKGSKRIEYDLLLRQDAVDKSLLKDNALAHELYRFRILAGPVFTTLRKRNKPIL